MGGNGRVLRRGSVSEVDGERDKATELPTRQFVLNHRQSAASAGAPPRRTGAGDAHTAVLADSEWTATAAAAAAAANCWPG